MTPSNVLVLGGSGFVGRSVCELLVRRSGSASGRIVVPSRRPANAKHIQFLPTLQVVDADLYDDVQLARLVAGCDAVINLVAILHGSAADFEQVHVVLPRRLAAACVKAGVRRIVHVSALGVARDAPSLYLRSKAAGEQALRDAALDLTILRPSVIFGEHDRFMNLFATLLAWSPLLPLAGADAKFQPVWVDDVTQAIVHCLDRPATIGQTIDCAGPEVFTLAGLVRNAGIWSGHRRPILPLPEWLGRIQAWCLEKLPGPGLMSRDNLDSMRVPNVASGSLPGLESLGISATPIAGIAAEYLQRTQGPARLDAWRTRAGRP